MSTGSDVRHPVVGMYSFKTSDPQRLARFWADLMGLPLMDTGSGDLVMLDFDHEVGPVTWLFERQTGGSPSESLGLDIALEDEAAWASVADRAEQLGATRLSEHDESGARWIEMRDPDGNRFRVFAPRRPN